MRVKKVAFWSGDKEAYHTVSTRLKAAIKEPQRSTRLKAGIKEPQRRYEQRRERDLKTRSKEMW